MTASTVHHREKELAMIPHPMTQTALEDLRRNDLLAAVEQDKIASRAIAHDLHSQPNRSRGAMRLMSQLPRAAKWHAQFLRIRLFGTTENVMEFDVWGNYRVRKTRGI
jgi:hypothetical protein